MIDRKAIWDAIEGYDTDKIKIGAVASHSALDVFDGATEEGYHTYAICQKGREKTYANYLKSQRKPDGTVMRGTVDEAVIFDRFNEIMVPDFQSKMKKNNVIFIPNRSFSSYVPISDIEENFAVPMFGSRNLLRSEEREEQESYYDMLKKAGLPYPEEVKPDEIDELCIVKLHHAKKKLERGFFTASTPKEFTEKSGKLLKRGVITQDNLDKARIERYIIGPVFNLDYFYSPIEKEGTKLELLGVDWRFESSLDGHVRLPAPQQMALPDHQSIPEYTVCGHNSATLRESLLERAYELGEKYVTATKEYKEPGIIGPFCLQTCVDKDMKFYIYDVAPRIGGGTNVHVSVGHPYGNSLWRRPMSTGRRVALEIKRAVESDKLKEIVT